MRKLSLFSGIGGIDLAAHWAGMETVAFCEREPFPRRVLAHHWPDIPIYDDVCTLTREVLERDGIIGPDRAIDVISAGFPCQPFSHAGKRGGAEDERYLWPEVVRVVGELRPPWFVGENVTGLLSMVQPDRDIKMVSSTVNRWPEEDYYEAIYTQQEALLVGDICKDLIDIGYQVQVYVLPASAVGASHQRERVFIVANSSSAGTRHQRDSISGQRWKRTDPLQPEAVRQRHWENGSKGLDASDRILGNAERSGCSGKPRRRSDKEPADRRLQRDEEFMADSSRQLPHGKRGEGRGRHEHPNSGQDVADPNNERQQECDSTTSCSGMGHYTGRPHEGWIHGEAGTTQPGMGRGSDVLPAWLDGRAVNPLDALTEWIANYPQPALMGMPQYSWEPPRVATGIKERTPRLKALGNAVNPLQIYPIMAAIKMIHDYMRRSAQ